MPELPEVEYAARQLREHALGKTVTKVRVMHPALERSFTKPQQRAVVGRTVTEVKRRAKLQLVEFDDRSILEVHFRMTGDWSFGHADDEPQHLERGRIIFADHSRVSLIDGRAFAVITRHAPGAFILPPLGLEPLDDAFTGAALREAMASRRVPVKQALLDQKVVAGLGNIYVAEALWEAKIDPASPANSLDGRATGRLVKAIRKVLDRAPAGRYYYDGANAESEIAWRVYDREGQDCLRCRTPIARVGQGGRSTYYCPSCQR